MGLLAFYLSRAELQTGRELGEQLFSLAQRVQDPDLLLEAHCMLGDALFWLGELVPAQKHLEQAIALYHPQKHRSHAFLYGQDPRVTSLSYVSLTLWFLGYPDQALKRSCEAITLARELSHPYSLAFATNFAAALHQVYRKTQAVQKLAESAVVLSTEQGFPEWLAMGTLLQGWVLATQGRADVGVETRFLLRVSWTEQTARMVMRRPKGKPSASVLEKLLGEASWLLSHAEALADYGRVEEATAELARAASCEEQVACLLRMLEKRGYRVNVVANGLEALEALSRIPYDLVLMDCQMPEMDGFEATCEIRRREGAQRHTPIIAMTANAMAEDRERCLAAGMDDYISKPVKAEELEAAVQRWTLRAEPEGGTPTGQPADAVIDRAEVWARVDGDVELLREMVRLFFEESPKLLGEIQEAVARGDSQALERTTHTFKGSVGNFGAKGAFEAALRLETMGRRGDLIRAQEAYAVLEGETERLRPALVALGEEETAAG